MGLSFKLGEVFTFFFLDNNILACVLVPLRFIDVNVELASVMWSEFTVLIFLFSVIVSS